MMKTFLAVLAIMAFLWTPVSRTAEPDTVTGKWHFVLDTQGGDREFDSILDQKDDKVTGKWAVSASNAGDPVAGTFTDKQLTIAGNIHTEDAGDGALNVKGKLADDGTLSGDWTFGDYSGTFKATRVKDDPAK